MSKQTQNELASPVVEHNFTITMKWTTAADFDLAAVYETHENNKGIVYFGDLGNMDNFPYIRLSGDKGVNDTAGQHEESMYIGQLDNIKTIWFFCWDYSMIQQGTPARFQDSDIKLVMMNNKTGQSGVIPLEKTVPGNVCCLAIMTSTDSKSSNIVKSDKSGILKGLYQIEQLLAVLTE